MNPQVLATVIEFGLMILAGTYVVLKGKRIIGKPPGVDNRADVWHAKWGKTYTNCGIALIGIGALLLISSVNRAPTTSEQRDKVTWQKATTDDSVADVSLPSVPLRKTVEANGLTTKVIVTTMDKGKCVFDLSYSKRFEPFLSLSDKELVPTMKSILEFSYPEGEVVLVEGGRMNDHPSVLAVVKSKGMRISTKLCLIGEKHYQVSAQTPDEPTYNEISKQFIDSFRLTTKTENDKR